MRAPNCRRKAGGLPCPSLRTVRTDIPPKKAPIDTLLNQALLADNHCFGCRHANPHGLHIEVQHDPADPQRLAGCFQPTPAMIGFPSITHGGMLYTAMDCLSTWACFLRAERDG